MKTNPPKENKRRLNFGRSEGAADLRQDRLDSFTIRTFRVRGNVVRAVRFAGLESRRQARRH